MNDPLRTPLCDLLGIELPIVQAPMAGWTTPALVAAVCEAGGLGSIPAARATVEELRLAIAEVRSRTDRPFAVNLLLAPPEPLRQDVDAMQRLLDRFRRELELAPAGRELSLPPSVLAEQLSLALEARVPVVSFAMGDPGPLVGRCHAAGARVIAMATTVDEAKRLADVGVDAVVAQGAEAGGHRSTFEVVDDDPPLVGTFVLVPQMVDAVGRPVIAAGGVTDGRGLAAALLLGAAGVQVGTRFLLAEESGASPSYRAQLIAGTEIDTVVTRSITGRPARALRNRLVRELLASPVEPLAWPYQAIAAGDVYGKAVAGDVGELGPLLAGQGLRGLTREQPAGDIVAEMAGQARALLDRGK